MALKRRGPRRKLIFSELDLEQILTLEVGCRTHKCSLLPRSYPGFQSIEEVERAWRLHERNPFLAKWLLPADDPEFTPGKRPSAWWRFNSPEPRSPRYVESETQQLHRMNILTENECRALALPYKSPLYLNKVR